ncbi:conserved hypothetical protein [Aeromonas veronii]|uniref:Uncharacterized protein n=1 Tax=Aeromonas veronii TaxID=654 RepID=A0A653KS11_AERVE|nr:conserved hypothetical protein [Aeromonas veronii]
MSLTGCRYCAICRAIRCVAGCPAYRASMRGALSGRHRQSVEAKSGFKLADQRLIDAVVFDLLQPLLELFGQRFPLRVVAGEGEPEAISGELANLDHLAGQLLLLDLEVARHAVHQDVVDPAAHQHLEDLGIGLGLKAGDPGVLHKIGGVGVAEGDAHPLALQRGELEIPLRLAGEGEDGKILLEHRGIVPVVLVAVLFGDGGVEAPRKFAAFRIVHAAGEGQSAKDNLDPFGGEHRLDQLRRQSVGLVILIVLVALAVGCPVIFGTNDKRGGPERAGSQQHQTNQPFF